MVRFLGGGREVVIMVAAFFLFSRSSFWGGWWWFNGLCSFGGGFGVVGGGLHFSCNLSF